MTESERKHPQARCEDCSLQEKKYVPTFEPRIKQYNVLWVAQAPGDTEQYTKVPLTGKSGKQHISICRQAGLNKSLMSHTNVVQCYPGRDPSTKRDYAPNQSEINCCKGRLKDDILRLQPELIIALGEPAMFVLTKASGGIQRHTGRFLDLLPEYMHECKVLCCLHPSYVMGQRQWIPIAVRTYELVKDFFKGDITEEFEPEMILDPTPEVLEEYLSDTDIVYGTDTETTGLNTRKEDIIGHSFARDTKSAVAVYYAGPHDPRWQIVKRFLEDPKHLKCWQNGSFDTAIGFTHGIVDKGFAFDTRLAQQLLASDLPSDLDFLRGHYTSIPPYKPPKAEMKKMLSWPKEKLLRYACLDAVTTKIVMHEQEKKLTEGQITLMQELLIPLVRVVNKMMHAGVLVDVNALAGLYMQCAPRTDEINGVFEKEGVNPRSSKQMAKFYDLKNTQKETLRAQIVRKHPKWELMELHLEYRALYKMQSQYLRGIYKRLDNGRIHTTFKIEGTGTGRLTSEDPNLNNVPAQMKVIYIPDPGHCFVVGDYSQIELWVMALIAEEELMLKELQDGVDIHYAMCQLCFPNVPLKHGKRKLDFDYHQDFAAKSVTFGTAYGRTPWSIAREFGVSVATAEDWQLKCIHRYPKLGVYKQRCEDAFKRKGSLTTPFGRVRQLASVKQGYNFPIQSTAADIIFQSLIMADAEGLSPRLSVYDDAVFQVNLKTFDEEFKKIQTVMEHPVPQLGGVQIPIKYTRGINWYEQEAIDV